MAYRRRYEDDLAYGDDYGPPSGGVQRWDRDRFESMRNRDRYGPRGGGGSRDYGYDERYERSSGPRSGTRYFEEDRYYEDDRWNRRQPEFMSSRNNETQGRELAPYMDRWEYDNPRGGNRGGPPPRPGIVRRQSSLDTFERRPLPNYADQNRDIDVKVRVSSPDGNRRDYYEDDFRERDRNQRPSVYEEDYRDFRIRRERERSVIRTSGSRYEDEEYDRSVRKTKRGKTKMPKRLVHKRAILDLGYPYEEDESFFMVQIALDKDQIDEVIKFSETCFREEKTSYRFNETRMLEAPPESSESQSQAPDEQPTETEVVETTTTRVIENPTDEELARYRDRVGGEGDDGNDNGNGGGVERGRSTHSQVNVNFESTEQEESSSQVQEQGSVHGSLQGSRPGAQHISDNLAASIRSPSPNNTLRPVDSRNSRSRSKSHHHRSRSSHVTRGREIVSTSDEEVRFEESNNIGGPLGALVLSDRRKSRGSGGYDDRRDRDIKAEIRALEREKEALRKERDADERRRKAERKYDEEIRRIDRSSRDDVADKDVVRVEKDRRGRLSLVRSEN